MEMLKRVTLIVLACIACLSLQGCLLTLFQVYDSYGDVRFNAAAGISVASCHPITFDDNDLPVVQNIR